MTDSPEAMTESPDPQRSVSSESLLEQSLALACPDGQVAVRPQRRSTCDHKITRRGVVWLGQTCNLRCYFCYFLDRIEDREHPEHAFMGLDKTKQLCKTLVDFYGNNSIDIQGGEPTIWKEVLELIRYCNEIGLHPTLITNAIVLDKKDRLLEFKNAGVRDFLVSVQGLGPVYDGVVGMPGGWSRQMVALRNMNELEIPFRFNCVLSKPVVEQLPQIAELAIQTGALAVNFLAFNPFYDQQKGKRSAENVARYRELSAPLNDALDALEGAGVEANVRYLPLCMVADRHRKSMYNFQQLSYDSHEWDFASWCWTQRQPQRMAAGELEPPPRFEPEPRIGRLRGPLRRLGKSRLLGPLVSAGHRALRRTLATFNGIDLYRNNARMRASDQCGYQYGKSCLHCDLRQICDGFHGDYTEMFGAEEALAVDNGGLVRDPTTFIRNQQKFVEPEDEHWLLS